ncbi:MAG: DUF4383 domain-containing protein [Phormidesmis sp.]
MAVRYFLLVVGFVYTLAGLLGFFPGFVEPAQVPEFMTQVGTGTATGFGYLFGLFPTTTVNNIFNLIIGIVGIAGFLSTEPGARIISDSFAVLFGLLTFLGLFPIANTAFGLMPIFGSDVWLHLATGSLAAYFGFARDQGRLRSNPTRDLTVQDPYGKEKYL